MPNLKSKDGRPVFLAVVLGLPGTGKTTFARALAQRLGARHLNTDIIRAEQGWRGQYREADKQRAYREMESQAAQALSQGLPVVADGTFYRAELRQRFQLQAEALGIPVFWIRVQAPEETVKARLAQKRDHSEADFRVYLLVKAAWAPLELPHLVLQSEELGAMIEKALAYLAR